MPATKIATCCYCGTKAALVLKTGKRRELTCTRCGAPLHAMKMFPAKRRSDQKSDPTTRQRVQSYHAGEMRRPKRKKASKRKKVFSKLWDVVEDVVDEIFD